MNNDIRTGMLAVVRALLFIFDAGEDHLRARNFGARVADVFLERGLAPDNPRILVGVGVAVALDGASLASGEAIEDGTNLILGVFADRVAWRTFFERRFASVNVLRRRGSCP